MEEVKIYYDPNGNTLTIWFGDPAAEDVSEEVGDGIILMKDQEGHVIGIEKIIFASHPANVRVHYESLPLLQQPLLADK